MTVASRAVTMAVMAEVRMMSMTDEGQRTNWLWVGQEVAPDSAPDCCVVEVTTADVWFKSPPEGGIIYSHSLSGSLLLHRRL